MAYAIFIYCLIFFILRLISPHSLINDEAEQIIQAQTYKLGFAQQPPLYSWIVKTVSFILPLNLWSLTFLKYLVSFVFYWFCYLSARLVFSEEKSYLVTSSLLYFITYSYDFNRDLTHTILLCAIAAISFWLYLKILEQAKLTYYLALGLCFGLGLLSKYNFIIFIFILILSSLLTRRGREIFCNIKVLPTILISNLIFLPHLLWLKATGFATFYYTLGRGLPGKDLSLVDYLITFAKAYYELALVLLIIVLIWAKYFRYQQSSDPKVQAIRISSLISISLPLILILSFDLSSFPAKWLAPINFLVILAIFSLLDLPPQKQFWHKVLLVLVISINIVVSVIGSFLPGLIGDIKKTQYPYAELCQELKKSLASYKDRELVFLIPYDPTLEGNLLVTLPRHFDSVELVQIKNFKTTPPGKTIIMLWDKNKKQFPGKFRQRFPRAVEQSALVADYLFTRNYPEKYKLGWAIQETQRNQ